MSKLLWKPSEERVKNSNMYRFMRYINEKYSQNFPEYNPLYQWSIENIPDFWESMWDFAEITYHAHRTWFDEDPSKGAKTHTLIS